MATMSRRCIPYTPHIRAAKETTFALVTTAGVHLRSQEPYDVNGDNSWREIPGDVASTDLMVTHDHYNHLHADQDINVVFPIDRLREFAAEGLIGGVAKRHLGFMGFSQKLRDLNERSAPAMADIIEHTDADGVILTAGCPLCHRTVVTIQREIEMRGIPTVLITLVPDGSRQMGPPRAVHPVNFLLGNAVGGPNQIDVQRHVLLDALRRWDAHEEPGDIWYIEYPEYIRDPAIPHSGEIVLE